MNQQRSFDEMNTESLRFFPEELKHDHLQWIENMKNETKLLDNSRRTYSDDKILTQSQSR